jgi:tetratricopeptide (TPR) repeat protein
LYDSTAKGPSEYFDTHVTVGHLRTLTFLALGDFDAAASAGDEIHTAIVTARGEKNYEAAFALYDMALVRLAQGRLRDANSLVAAFVPVDRELVGPDHPGLVTDVQIIARLSLAYGRGDAALGLLDYVVARRVAKFGEQHLLTWNARSLRADAETELGDYAAADRDFSVAILGMTKHFGPTHRDLGTMRRDYGSMLIEAGRFDAASEQLQAAQKIWEISGNIDHPYALACRELLAEVALRQGNSTSARQQLADIVERQRRHPDAWLARSLWALGTLDAAAHDTATAGRDLSEGADLLHKLGADGGMLAQRIRHAQGQVDSAVDPPDSPELSSLLEQARAIIAAAPQH